MNRQKIIAAIDAGSSQIKTLVAALTEEAKLKVIGVASLPARGIRKGQIVDIEEAGESIIQSVEAAERMAGYNLDKAFVSLGGAHIKSQNSKGVVAVTEPEGEISHEDVERVIEAAQAISLPSSREILHVLPRYYTVDGQEGVKDPIAMSGVRLEIETHIITASTMAVKNLTKCIAEMGVDVQAIVAAGLASAESGLSETEKELGVILIDIGGGTTDLLIYVEGSPFYTSVLPIGANNVTNDLAIGLRLSSLENAEKIKMALAEEKKKPALPNLLANQKKIKLKNSVEAQDDELNLAKLGIIDEKRTVSRKTLTEGIIKPRLNEILTMVSAEVKESGAGGLTPAGIVITGGGALTPGIIETAKRILAMPARVGQPEDLTGLIDDIQTPAFAAAAGLIKYGVKNEPQVKSNSFTGRFTKGLPKIPVKGAAAKIIDLVKSFLP